MTYALVTPARNEARYIEKTIQSVVSQTILPVKWIIVSDGSTDHTDQIVRGYAAKYDFIQLLRREPDSGPNYASKAYAVRAAMELLNRIEYDFIGNLDADISFDPDYFERILVKFQENPNLGIAGGTILELQNKVYKPRFGNTTRSVPGAIQLFRRRCFEKIDGYVPLKTGGIDSLAEVMVRMHGWQVRSFRDIPALHHKRTGWATQSVYVARFRQGVMDYHLGMHPLYALLKFFRRLCEKPYLFGSALRAIGFTSAYAARKKRQIPDEVMRFVRHEQMARMRILFFKDKEKV